MSAWIAEELEVEGVVVDSRRDEGGIARLGKGSGELEQAEVSEMICVAVVWTRSESDLEFAVRRGADV